MSVSLVKEKVLYWAKLEVVKSQLLSKIIGIGVFIILTTLGAYIYLPLPFTPVPITLQTLFVLLSGAMLGPLEGFFSQLVYLVLGSLGFPVFSGARGGMLHLLGPTGGYLWGFLFSAWLVGKLIYGKKLNRFLLFFYFSLGIFVIYFFGLIQLKFFINKDLPTLISYGVLPFLLPDLLKVLVATWGYRFRRRN
ncbi:MAG: biotin transporter BioY [Candidatus Omnitrophica bacterium]|nr:biotin transporter BioY [Candidatus Omnitrophota bacterium]